MAPSAPTPPDVPTDLSGWALFTAAGSFAVLVAVNVWKTLKGLGGETGYSQQFRDQQTQLTEIRLSLARLVALMEEQVALERTRLARREVA